MKKSLGLAVLTMMFLATPVFASGGAGDRSETETTVNGETKLEVSINQYANVKNEVTEKVNTGENVASENTACCETEKVETGAANVNINTGSAESNVKIENNVNTAKVEVGEQEEEQKEEEENESEEGQSPAEIEVPQAAQGAAAAEVGPSEVSGQLAAETLPETGADGVGLALLLSGILLLAGYDLKKIFELKRSNLI